MSSTSLKESTSVLETQTYDGLFDDLALRRELSANLVEFCRYLRQHGISTGLGEQMNALRALEELDLKN